MNIPNNLFHIFTYSSSITHIHPSIHPHTHTHTHCGLTADPPSVVHPPPDGVIFCSRPQGRLWRASLHRGTVLQTYIYQNALPPSFQIGVLLKIGNALLTWSEHGIALLNVKDTTAKAWFTEIKGY